MNFFNNSGGSLGYQNRNGTITDMFGRALFQLNPQQSQQTAQPANTGMFGDPFGTAMSGNERGTLQPYVNRMTQNASNALYGGLLNYSPQSMVAGSAGGTPQNSTVPQFDIQSALKGMNGQSLGFGNRSWMNRG